MTNDQYACLTYIDEGPFPGGVLSRAWGIVDPLGSPHVSVNTADGSLPTNRETGDETFVSTA